MRGRARLILVLPALVVSCSLAVSFESVDAAVQSFHRMLDAAQYHEIYAAAHADYRNAIAEDGSTEFLRAVHDKLGGVKTASRSRWNVNYSPGGRTMTVDYDTVFEKGKALETFVFRFSGDSVLLAGYHINSRDLIVK